MTVQVLGHAIFEHCHEPDEQVLEIEQSMVNRGDSILWVVIYHSTAVGESLLEASLFSVHHPFLVIREQSEVDSRDLFPTHFLPFIAIDCKIITRSVVVASIVTGTLLRLDTLLILSQIKHSSGGTNAAR